MKVIQSLHPVSAWSDINSGPMWVPVSLSWVQVSLAHWSFLLSMVWSGSTATGFTTSSSSTTSSAPPFFGFFDFWNSSLRLNSRMMFSWERDTRTPFTSVCEYFNHLKGDILNHRVWVWLAEADLKICLFWHHKWVCPPRRVLNRSVYRPTQWTVANVAQLSVIHLGGHA